MVVTRQRAREREPIFDRGPRESTALSHHAESMFAFLNRIDIDYWAHARVLVQEWADRLPDADYIDVRKRIRSRDDEQFRSAFLELYVHESLTRAGYHVAIHPEVPNASRHPDFLATGPDGSFYVEAIAPATSKAKKAEGRRQAAFYDVVDRVRSADFLLRIDELVVGPRAAVAAPLKRELERWLSTLDPDTVHSTEPMARHLWENDGWQASFQPIPIRTEKRGIRDGSRAIGMFANGGASIVDDAPTIRRALSAKHRAYGDLPHPFVVAVGLYVFDSDLWHAKNAFYGHEVIQIVDDNFAEAVPSRRGDGYFGGGGGGWRNTQVSAVLLVNQLMPHSLTASTATLWKHPGAVKPLHADPGFPARTYELHGNELGEADAACTVAERFGLSEPWPPGQAWPK